MRKAATSTTQTDVPAPEVDVWTPIGPIAINWPGGSSTGVLFHIAIPASNPSVIYVSSRTSGVWASSDHGATWRAASGDLPSLVVLGLAVDAAAPEHLYVVLGESGVYGPRMPADRGRVPTVPLIPWTTVFTRPDAPAEKVTMFAIGPDRTYHVATNLGRIYAGVGPGGGDWPLAFHHPSGDRPTDPVVDPDDPQVLYAAFAGGGERVYRLHRSAPAALFTAIPITAGLPSGLTVNTLAVDAMRPPVTYAGTNQGVYRARSTDQGASWVWDEYNTGLPPADVTTGVMRAATFGRSAFQVNTDAPVGSLLNASGRLTFLRVHDVGTRWGRPQNQLDAEVILTLDTNDALTFGFQLRADSEAPTRSGMFSVLRAAFVADGVVSIDFIRSAPRRHGDPRRPHRLTRSIVWPTSSKVRAN
jgi:hypothetical protein